MNSPTCHYLVETCFWRQAHGTARSVANIASLDEPIQKTRKEFVADEPLVAREMAFSHFSSIIDVLYQGLGGQYTTDLQARKDLQPYFDSGDAFEAHASSPSRKFKLTLDMMNGIEIYMILTYPEAKTKAEQVRKYCIHGIRFIDYADRLDRDIIEALEGLAAEYRFYTQNQFQTGHYAQILDLARIGGSDVSILATPFDWEELLTDFEGKNLITSDFIL